MGINDFAIHNVLRTYSRQDRLGRINKSRTQAAAARPADNVSLSPTARKIGLISQLAAELVDGEAPQMDPTAREEAVKARTRTLLQDHRDQVGDKNVTPEKFARLLEETYARV